MSFHTKAGAVDTKRNISVFSNPVEAAFGVGCFKLFLEELKNARGGILLLTGDKSTEKIEPEISASVNRERLVHIGKVAPSPDISHIFDYYKQIKAIEGFSPDFIFAAGGGSVLDTAKALKAVLGADIESLGHLRSIITAKGYATKKCPLFLCPTTAGTGAELTKWATVWDRAYAEKYSIEHDGLYARKAFIDPALTYSAPMAQSVSCAFDAFSHAVESYWAPGGCKISREYSLKAIELFERNIDSLIESAHTDAREGIALCGYFAGRAFSHTKTTVCHAISYPLTMLYGVPHGVAASMSIPHMLEINSGSIAEESRLLYALGASDWSGLKQRIRKRLEKAQIHYRLSEYGFNIKDVDAVSAKCFTPGRVDNNPVKITIEQIKSILTDLI